MASLLSGGLRQSVFFLRDFRDLSSEIAQLDERRLPPLQRDAGEILAACRQPSSSLLFQSGNPGFDALRLVQQLMF